MVKESKSIIYDKISIEHDGDIIFITIGKYKLLLAYGKIGRNAKAILDHLMFTARLQKTNTPRATDLYIMKGLSMGADQFKPAKKLLYKLELIKSVTRRDESGRIIGHYIEVITKSSPFEYSFNDLPEGGISTHVGKPRNGKSRTNALTRNRKGSEHILRMEHPEETEFARWNREAEENKEDTNENTK